MFSALQDLKENLVLLEDDDWNSSWKKDIER